jgi:hypothetical protein
VTAIDFAAIWKKYGRIWRTLSPMAHNNKFGMTMPLQITGDIELTGPSTTIKLFDLSREIDNSSSDPCGLVLSLDLIMPDLDELELELFVFADLRWSTGSGIQNARVDIPARGTVVQMVAGDGMGCDVTRVGGPGASPTQNITVRGTVGFSDGGGADSAQYTVRVPVLPQPAALQIPKFARRVTVLGSGGALVRLTFHAFLGGPPIATVTAPAFPDFIEAAIPNGATYFTVFGPAASSARAIFDLAL